MTCTCQVIETAYEGMAAVQVLPDPDCEAHE